MLFDNGTLWSHPKTSDRYKRYRKVGTRYRKVDNNTTMLVFLVLQGSLKCKDACMFPVYYTYICKFFIYLNRMKAFPNVR